MADKSRAVYLFGNTSNRFSLTYRTFRVFESTKGRKHWPLQWIFSISVLQSLSSCLDIQPIAFIDHQMIIIQSFNHSMINFRKYVPFSKRVFQIIVFSFFFLSVMKFSLLYRWLLSSASIFSKIIFQFLSKFIFYLLLCFLIFFPMNQDIEEVTFQLYLYQNQEAEELTGHKTT